MSEERYIHALQVGLAEIPMSPATCDFDSRVLAAVAAPRYGWQTLFGTLRPALGGAAVAMPLMLWLIYTSQSTQPHRTAHMNLDSASRTIPESALDSPTLTPMSLRRSTRLPLIKKDAEPSRAGRINAATSLT